MKTKRMLSNLNFSEKGAHVALVSKKLQGGPANGYDVVLTKAEYEYSTPEVRMETSMRDFLKMAYGLYSDDANELAGYLGYESHESMDDEYYKPRNMSVDLLKAAAECDVLPEEIHKELLLLKEKFESETIKKEAKMAKEDKDTTVDIQKAVDIAVQKALASKDAELKETLEAKDVELKKAQDDAAGMTVILEKQAAEKEVEVRKSISDEIDTISFIDATEKEGMVDFLYKSLGGDIDVMVTLKKAQEIIEKSVTEEVGHSEEKGLTEDNSVLEVIRKDKGKN